MCFTYESELDNIFYAKIVEIAREAQDYVNPGERISLLDALSNLDLQTNTFNKITNYWDETNHIVLHRLITEFFNESELKTLCFEMKIDYDSLEGRGKESKARELVAYCKRHHYVSKLARMIETKRPKLSIGDLNDFIIETL